MSADETPIVIDDDELDHSKQVKSSSYAQTSPKNGQLHNSNTNELHNEDIHPLRRKRSCSDRAVIDESKRRGLTKTYLRPRKPDNGEKSRRTKHPRS